MAYGFSSLNSTGLVQIDDNFSNLALAGNGTLSLTSYSVYYIPLSEDDLYFIRPVSQGDYITTYVTIYNNSLYLGIICYTTNSAGTPTPGTACAVEYLKCKPSNKVLLTPPTSGFGFNVYKSDSNLAFTSELVCPQILEVLSVNTVNLDIYGEVINYYSLPNTNPNKKRYFGTNLFTPLGIIEWTWDYENMNTKLNHLAAAFTGNTTVAVKCLSSWEWGVYASEIMRENTNNQLLIVEF